MLSFLRTGFCVWALCLFGIGSVSPVFAQTAATTAPAPAATAPAARPGVFPFTLSKPLGTQTTVTGLNDYIRAIYRYALAIVTTIAIIMITYGGFRYLIGATSGDIAKGKEIISNAIIGLLLVFGAYLILQTVNPQTLTLNVPALTSITGQGLPAPVASCNVRRVTMDSPACALDADCTRVSGYCMRTSYHSPGSVTESPGGPYDPVDPATHGGGQCSLGGEGQRCRCAGFGCRLTTAYASGSQYEHDLGTLGLNTPITNPAPLAAPRDSVYDIYNSTLEALRRDAPLTNNGGQGFASCRTGLSCVYQSPAGDRSGWFCMGVPSRSGGRPGNFVSRACVSDLGERGCLNGDVCLRTDAGQGDTYNAGECAPRSGAPLGARCGCSRYGCQGTLPYRLHGTTLTTNFVECSTGLVCALFNYTSHNAAAPPDGDWFCATSVSEDDQFLTGSCRANAQTTSTGPITGHCGYSCERTGAAAQTPSVSVACTGDTQAAANSVCSTTCGGGANSCATLFPGSTCANPRCVPDAAPAR